MQTQEEHHNQEQQTASGEFSATPSSTLQSQEQINTGNDSETGPGGSQRAGEDGGGGNGSGSGSGGEPMAEGGGGGGGETASNSKAAAVAAAAAAAQARRKRSKFQQLVRAPSRQDLIVAEGAIRTHVRTMSKINGGESTVDSSSSDGGGDVALSPTNASQQQGDEHMQLLARHKGLGSRKQSSHASDRRSTVGGLQHLTEIPKLKATPAASEADRTVPMSARSRASSIAMTPRERAEQDVDLAALLAGPRSDIYANRSLSSTAPTMKELYDKYDTDGDGSLSVDELHSCLSTLGLVTSREQAFQWMDNIDQSGSGLIDFHEFVAFMSYAWRVLVPLMPGPVMDEGGKVGVFLGGACNPTTWRKDIAIPVLERTNVPYYNPQVDDWSPELVAIEAKAKEEAPILLFVINNQTRGLASMIEVSELITSGRKVILVLQDIDGAEVIGENPKFGEAEVDANQLKDLNRARAYLADVALRHGVICYNNVLEATMACVNEYMELLERDRMLQAHLGGNSSSRQSASILWEDSDAKNSEYERRVSDLQNQVQQLKSELDASNAEKQSALETCSKLRSEIDALNKEQQDNKDAASRRDGAVKDALELELSNLRNQLQASDDQVASLRSELDSLRAAQQGLVPAEKFEQAVQVAQDLRQQLSEAETRHSNPKRQVVDAGGSEVSSSAATAAASDERNNVESGGDALSSAVDGALKELIGDIDRRQREELLVYKVSEELRSYKRRLKLAVRENNRLKAALGMGGAGDQRNASPSSRIAGLQAELQSVEGTLLQRDRYIANLEEDVREARRGQDLLRAQLNARSRMEEIDAESQSATAQPAAAVVALPRATNFGQTPGEQQL